MTAFPLYDLSNKRITYIDANTEQWLEELKFNEIELKVCTHNLESMINDLKRHPKALPMVEHFQNQFLIQQENIHKLKLYIRRFHGWLQRVKTPLEVPIGKKYFHFLDENIKNFKAVFEDLLREFKVFLRHEFFITHFVF